jgi:hypothetical protein
MPIGSTVDGPPINAPPGRWIAFKRICEITGPPPSNTVAGILHRSSRAHTQPLRSLIVVLSPTAQPTRFRTLSEVPVSPKQTARRSAGFDRIVRASSRARRTSGVRATNDCNARA